MVSINREPTPHCWSLAFWIHPTMWRQGFATEIGDEALRLAFSEFGAEKVEAGAAMWNAGSQGVLERLGFTFLAENPDGYRVQGRSIRTREYELLADTWRTLRRDVVG
jgi:RimJ/RimL family protein N-acetyltransferase